MFQNKANSLPLSTRGIQVDGSPFKSVLDENPRREISSASAGPRRRRSDDKECASSSAPSCHLSFPVQLTLRPSPGGKAELQLRLVEFHWGEACDRRRQSEGASTSASARLGRAALKAGGIFALRTMFPSAPLAPIVGAIAAGEIGPSALKSLPKRLKAPASLASAVSAVKAAARWPLASLPRTRELLEGASLLAALFAAVRIASPDLHQALRAMMALVPVAASYARLSKDCELGRIPPGARQELTWRARHRWAAQRLAPFLGDLNLRPPFAPLLEVVERLTLVLHVAGADPGARGALPLSTPLLGDLPLAVREGARGAEAWAGRCTLLAASYDLSVRVRAVDERALYRRVGPREDTTADHPQPGTTRTRRTARGPGALDSPAASTSGTRTPLEILDLESGKPVDLGLAAALQHRLRGAAAEVQGAATPVHPSPARPPSRLQGTTGWQGGSRPAPSSAASTPARRSSLYAPSAAGDPGSHLHLETLAPGPYEEVERGGPGLEIEIPDGIAVFGRGDHLPEDARDLTVSERLELAGRAGWLVLVFFPFLFLGTALLVASRAIGGTTAATAAAPAKTAQGRPKRNDRTAALRPSHALTNGSDRRRGDSAQPLPSTTHHTSNNNTPINGESKREKVDPSSVSGWMRLQAWRLLLSGCRNSGVAFIKWGQWASSRQDLYPEDLCEVLAELCDQAPSHAFKETRAIVERNLGGRIEDIFESFDPAPLASGSVAQVHRAQLRMADGTLRTVAVKVRHPNVAVRIQQDFQILKPLARASKSIPSLRPFNLDESVKQFSSSMVAQADLRVEAVHLARARSEFKHTNTVSIPAPLPGYATEAVLVESFEPGESVARFIQRPSALNSKIVTIGLSTYLRMILCEGLVHTDLHPGNILARVRTNGAAAPKSLSQLLADHGEDELMKQELELVLLDFGLAVEMDAFTRLNFLSFLFSIGSGDGRRAADILLEWVEDQTCPDPEGFRRDMAALYAAHCDIRRGVDVDYVLKEILRVARRHEVAVDGSLASLIIGVVVITGFATSLDPGVNLIDAAVPAFLAYNLTGRIVERRL